MSSILERSFSILEHLALHPEGRPLSALASELALPLSATHRLLTELIRCGYVRQQQSQGDYTLTIKLVSIGLGFLSASGIVDIAQPLLDRLATASGELVRLAVVDGDALTFVAKAQGATRGLRYDPDMGLSVNLSCSAAGHAWLSTMSDEAALRRVAGQGFGRPEDYGPRAPTTVKDLLAFLDAARERGFSVITEVFSPGMSAMAAPIRSGATGTVVGVVTIAGPLVRLTETRMAELGPALLETTDDLARASGASALFRRAAR
jgi:DNA-binding IclR family transcriptional regulator